MRERESFLSRLEERLSRVSAWLAERKRGGDARGHERAEALRREIARARHAAADTARADLARAVAAVEDMKRDYEAPLPHTALKREELEAFRRHLHTTARLLRDMSDLDSPSWTRSNDEYERSWAEVERAFEGDGHAASP